MACRHGRGRGPLDRRGPARCSFCGRTRGQGAKLIAGPGVYTCGRCVTLARTWPAVDYPGRTCSFCGMWTPGKGRLVARHATAICDQCLDLCDEIIAEEQGGGGSGRAGRGGG
ncbi:MAG TPA: ClpX C4-type zinc finger protein [Actinomycetota bacterium]|nr:ClpX C4-type zinc finger protein [Actinomycetota bacterium]